MCLAVPGKITRIDGAMGEVELAGVKRSVSLLLVPDAKVGDYVLVHVGFAIQVVDEDEARQTLSLLEEMAAYEPG